MQPGRPAQTALTQTQPGALPRSRRQASPGAELLATVDRHTALVWQADSFPRNPLALTHTKALTCAALS